MKHLLPVQVLLRSQIMMPTLTMSNPTQVLAQPNNGCCCAHENQHQLSRFGSQSGLFISPAIAIPERQCIFLFISVRIDAGEEKFFIRMKCFQNVGECHGLLHKLWNQKR
jgi:hypothetical protein